MTAWLYIESEPGLYTVGYYDQKNKWHPISDHESEREALAKIRHLHGVSDQTSNATANSVASITFLRAGELIINLAQVAYFDLDHYATQGIVRIFMCAPVDSGLDLVQISGPSAEQLYAFLISADFRLHCYDVYDYRAEARQMHASRTMIEQAEQEVRS